MEVFSVLSHSIALLMLWIFIASGLSKLAPANQLYYQTVLADYGIKLPELAKVCVRLLGVIEIISGLAIIFPATRTFGVVVCSLLFAVYFCAIARQLWQGKTDTDCGCAGPAGSVKVSPLLLLRNTMFVALLGVCFLGALSTANQFVSIFVWLLAFPMGIFLILMNQSLEQLLANQQKLRLMREAI